MARQTTKRRTLTALGLVTSVAAISGGASALHAWQPFAEEFAEAPEVEWPDEIDRLAAFVERVGGFDFVESIEIEFIDDADDYADAVDTDPLPDNGEEPYQAERAAQGRALGWWAGSYDPFVETPFEARRVYMTNDRQRILVNDRDADDVDVRVGLVTALAIVTLEQNVAIFDRLAQTTTAQEYNSLYSLFEGFIAYVQQRYIDDLSGDDLDDLAAANEGFAESGPPTTQLAADLLEDQFGFSVGATFVRSLVETDRDLLGEAFANPPTAVDQLLLPVTRFIDVDAVEPLDDITAPTGSELIFVSKLGAVGLYATLAAALPPTQALAAADGWGNDSMVVYEADGVICIDVHIVADSADDADLLDDALRSWAATRPAAASTLVGREGTSLYFTSCDPGEAARQLTTPTTAIDHLLGRSRLISFDIADSVDPAEAECVWSAVFRSFTLTEIEQGLFGFEPEGAAADAAAEIDDRRDECSDE